MRRILFLFAIVGAALAGGGWWMSRRNAIPEVRFAAITRGSVASTLITNGKAEPVEWMAARAELEGILASVTAARGQKVTRGSVIARIEARDLEATIVTAESRLASAQAELATYERGGTPSALAEIDAALRKAAEDKRVASAEAASLTRLIEKNAATRHELQLAENRVRAASVEMENLQARRKALMAAEGRAAVEARIRDARAAAELARATITKAAIRAPISGVVYNLAVRAGAFVHPGDLVAEIGDVSRLRVVIYVDEPELGRVEAGLPVAITWDAQPGRTWQARVDRLPSQIIAMGSRQVGEVYCSLDGDAGLPPGANVNAEVQSKKAENVVVVPKEALRRDGAKSGSFVLEGSRVRWREVRLGVAGMTSAEVVSGLREGELVALPGDVQLADGAEVRVAR